MLIYFSCSCIDLKSKNLHMGVSLKKGTTWGGRIQRPKFYKFVVHPREEIPVIS